MLKKPEYLGVLFLHENFVTALLNAFDGNDYEEAEASLVTELMPYIINSQTLDKDKLIKWAYYFRYTISGWNDKYGAAIDPELKKEYDMHRETINHLAQLEQEAEKAKAIYDEKMKSIRVCSTPSGGLGDVYVAYYQAADAQTKAKVALEGEATSLLYTGSELVELVERARNAARKESDIDSNWPRDQKTAAECFKKLRAAGNQ